MIKKKGIRLGNQTSFSAPHFDVPFNFAFREKFSAFEFFPDKKEDGGGWSVAEISKEVRTDLKKKAKASDISLSLHLPWQANPLNEEFEALLPENIEFATEIGAQLVVVHLYCEEGIDAYIRSVEPLITETAACGMLLAIENTPLTSSSDFNLLFKALDEKEDLPTGHVGMCLDIGHANLQKSTQNDYLRFIDALDMHVPIIHGHVHENYGESDSHLTLFTGPSKESVEGITGMVKRLTGRGFDRTLIFEQWPEPPSLLVEAARKLTEIISSFEKEEKVSFHPEKPGSFVSSLLVADKKKRNWREKLDTVCTFLLDQEISRVPENISAIAIYLSFIGRGAVKMAEDGGHFRPSHHAKTASRVEKRLAQVTNSDTYFILQKIYPWLPSHDKKFTCAEPLTHIRDIAHRNDIPRDLKDEIKHTLQNKLHRCAGPEDLITSEKILIKITAPGTSFSAPFVEEFRVFHDELREFFNARSLDERLEQMVRKNEIPEVEEVRAFITLKAGPEESFEKLLNVFDSLTNLRGLFFPLHWKKDDEKAQHFRLTDIALDGYAFVVSSRINSFIEEAETTEWKMALSALRLLVLNIEFNKIFPDECSLITGELNSLSQGFSEKRREDLLRLKASLERIIRVADAHAERVLALFQKQAGPIGDGLKIQKSAVTFFSEGVIRGDLIFQLANLSSFLLKKVKEFAGISAWEVLFPGECSGRLIDAGDDGFAREFDEPVILLASEVSGDEEIFPGVTAVVLKQGIPLLSHLGIRAREQGVVFVTCEDEQMLENISSYMGRVVHLKADSRNINIKLSTETEQKKSVGAPLPVKTHELDLAEEFAVIGLDQVSARNSGGKAFGLKTLTEVSEKTGSGFSVPPVLVLPFPLVPMVHDPFT
ncbi:MAG: phosphohistidine-like domain-containing protein, partial [Nitrospinota bacterium]